MKVKATIIVLKQAPMLERQERHNERTLTALITRNRSHNKMDAIITRGEKNPARAYNSNTMPQALPAGEELPCVLMRASSTEVDGVIYSF